jgi:hypothetical protein
MPIAQKLPRRITKKVPREKKKLSTDYSDYTDKILESKVCAPDVLAIQEKRIAQVNFPGLNLCNLRNLWTLSPLPLALGLC